MGTEQTRKKRAESGLQVHWAVAVLAMIGYLFVVATLLVVIGASFNRDYMAFPPENLSLTWFGQALRQPEFVQAAKVSLGLGVDAAVLSTALAISVCVMLRRLRPGLRTAISAAFLGPLLVPSVILALALYQVVILATRTTSFLALLIGHVVITLPYPIRTITAVLERVDPSVEDAAASVGATPLQTALKIVLPLAKSGVIAGALFAFIVSWNDFPISIFLAPPDGIPLPVRIYSYILFEYKPLVAAISTYLVLLSIGIVYAIERLVGLTVFVGAGTR